MKVPGANSRPPARSRPGCRGDGRRRPPATRSGILDAPRIGMVQLGRRHAPALGDCANRQVFLEPPPRRVRRAGGLAPRWSAGWRCSSTASAMMGRAQARSNSRERVSSSRTMSGSGLGARTGRASKRRARRFARRRIGRREKLGTRPPATASSAPPAEALDEDVLDGVVEVGLPLRRAAAGRTGTHGPRRGSGGPTPRGRCGCRRRPHGQRSSKLNRAWTWALAAYRQPPVRHGRCMRWTLAW